MTASPYINPEQSTRQQIDTQLVASGWLVQDYKQFSPFAGQGIAVREAPLKSGAFGFGEYLKKIAPTARGR